MLQALILAFILLSNLNDATSLSERISNCVALLTSYTPNSIIQQPIRRQLIDCSSFLLLPTPDPLSDELNEFGSEASAALTGLQINNDLIHATALTGLRHFTMNLHTPQLTSPFEDSEVKVLKKLASSAQSSAEHELARLIFCARSLMESDRKLREACASGLTTAKGKAEKLPPDAVVVELVEYLDKHKQAEETLSLFIVRGVADAILQFVEFPTDGERREELVRSTKNFVEKRLLEKQAMNMRDLILYPDHKNLKREHAELIAVTSAFVGQFPQHARELMDLELVNNLVEQDKSFTSMATTLGELLSNIGSRDADKFRKLVLKISALDFKKLSKHSIQSDKLTWFFEAVASQLIHKLHTSPELASLTVQDPLAYNGEILHFLKIQKSFEEYFGAFFRLGMVLGKIVYSHSFMALLLEKLNKHIDTLALVAVEGRINLERFHSSAKAIQKSISVLQGSRDEESVRPKSQSLQLIEAFLQIDGKKLSYFQAKFRLRRSFILRSLCINKAILESPCEQINGSLHSCSDEFPFIKDDILHAGQANRLLQHAAKNDGLGADERAMVEVENSLQNVYKLRVPDVFEKLGLGYAEVFRRDGRCSGDPKTSELVDAYIEQMRRLLDQGFNSLGRLEGMHLFFLKSTEIRDSLARSDFAQALIDFEGIRDIMVTRPKLEKYKNEEIKQINEVLDHFPFDLEGRVMLENFEESDYALLRDFLRISEEAAEPDSPTLQALRKKLKESEASGAAQLEAAVGDERDISMQMRAYVDARVRKLFDTFRRMLEDWKSVTNVDVLYAATVGKYARYSGERADVEIFQRAVFKVVQCFSYSEHLFVNAVDTISSISSDEKARVNARRTAELQIRRLMSCRELKKVLDAHNGKTSELGKILARAVAKIRKVPSLETEHDKLSDGDPAEEGGSDENLISDSDDGREDSEPDSDNRNVHRPVIKNGKKTSSKKTGEDNPELKAKSKIGLIIGLSLVGVLVVGAALFLIFFL